MNQAGEGIDCLFARKIVHTHVQYYAYPVFTFVLSTNPAFQSIEYLELRRSKSQVSIFVVYSLILFMLNLQTPEHQALDRIPSHLEMSR